jgi:hypothetical protein
MRIVNAIDTQEFDALSWGEFFAFTGNGKIGVKTAPTKYRQIINGFMSMNEEVTSPQAMVNPLELSTCRFRRALKPLN